MDEKETKYLDELSKMVIEKSAIDSPSFNFTDAVMSQIHALPQSEATVYKPLISKPVWFVIGLGFLTIVLYNLFYGTETGGTDWMQSLNFNALSNLNTMPNVSLSKTFAYAMLFFGIMICVQIPILKNHFNKRFEV